MNKVVVRNLYICTTLWFQFGFWYCYKINYELLCRSVKCIFLRYPNVEHWYVSLYSVPRACERKGRGLNPLPLSLIFYKNFITFAKEI